MASNSVEAPVAAARPAPPLEAPAEHVDQRREVRSFLGGRKTGDRCLYVSTGGFTREARTVFRPDEARARKRAVRAIGQALAQGGDAQGEAGFQEEAG